MKDFYRDQPGRAVELHVEDGAAEKSSRLRRTIHREMYGMRMPVLSPVDLFLSQGLHAFKDVCSAFSRISHLLEFYRHTLARRDDDAFWRQLRSAAESERRAALGLGVVTYFLTSVMGDFAPEALLEWTVRTLPTPMRLWVDRYGGYTVFEKYPGTKLYLMLQEQVEAAGVQGRRPIRTSLFPKRLPPAVIRSLPDEKMFTRIARYYLQFGFLISRARFHSVEGLRYAWELHRWRRFLEQIS